MSSVIDKKVEVKEMNSTESCDVIKNNTEFLGFAAVTPQESKSLLSPLTNL